MEVEVKYALPSEETLESIWNDSALEEISDMASSERLPFLAVYYDTKNMALRNARYTLRARSEGNTAFATVKWGGSSEGALHKREEINVTIDPDTVSQAPDIQIFKGSSAYRELRSLTRGRKLQPILTMDFTRSRRRLTYMDNIIELALDTGSIATDNGTVPILEMELEHYAGPDEDSVRELGGMIAEKYGLTEDSRSKYARGLMLLYKNRDYE